LDEKRPCHVAFRASTCDATSLRIVVSLLRFGGARQAAMIDAKQRARFAVVASASRRALIVTKR
jgi:hypothetical protein